MTIRYQAIDRRTGELVTRERSFATEAEMQRWVARQERLAEAERGGFVGVLAYSND
jgi:hypothetical protein